MVHHQWSCYAGVSPGTRWWLVLHSTYGNGTIPEGNTLEYLEQRSIRLLEPEVTTVYREGVAWRGRDEVNFLLTWRDGISYGWLQFKWLQRGCSSSEYGLGSCEPAYDRAKIVSVSFVANFWKVRVHFSLFILDTNLKILPLILNFCLQTVAVMNGCLVLSREKKKDILDEIHWVTVIIVTWSHHSFLLTCHATIMNLPS